MIDIKSHNIISDREGRRLSVVVPYAEYEEMLALLRQVSEGEDFAVGLRRSLEEAEAYRRGEVELRGAQALLDEL